MRLNIIIPVYNSEKTLSELVNSLIDKIKNITKIKTYKIILINDCSEDNSWSNINEICKKNTSVVGINLTKNYGQHNAIMAGLNFADGDYTILMDDDYQHDPAEITNLIDKIDSGFDVCFTKYQENKYGFFKKLGSKLNNLLANILIDKPKNIYLSSYKCMSKKISDEIKNYDGPFVYIDGLIFDITKNVTTINVNHLDRKDGKSNYNFIKLFSLWLRVLTNFSIAPLRFVTFLGFLMTILSILALILIISIKIANPDIAAGWTSLASIIIFFSGLQFVAIGLIGEYVGKSYLKLNKKPQYIIRNIINQNQINEK